MLWNSIYEFFVMHIFGGVLNNGTQYQALLGGGYNGSGWFNLHTSLAYSGIKILVGGVEYNMPLGNYFSLLGTIVSIVIILVLCCLFVYKLVRIVAGLMTHR